MNRIHPGIRHRALHENRAGNEDALSLVVIAPNGEVEREGLVTVQGAHIGGLVVDSLGNLYLGAQLSAPGSRIPAWAKPNLPADSPHHHPRAAYAQEAAIVKFPPDGGHIRLDENGPLTGHRQRPAWVALSDGVRIITRGGFVPGKTGETASAAPAKRRASTSTNTTVCLCRTCIVSKFAC